MTDTTGTKTVLETFECEGYMVHITELTDYHINFECKCIAGHAMSENVPVYQTEDGDTVEDWNKGQMELSGSIKWDGCSNWDYHTDDCLKHFCGKADAAAFGRLLDGLHDTAAAKIAKWEN